MKRFRFIIRRSAQREDGQHVHGYGIRVGYWPCLKAPFISMMFAVWHIEAWYGLPSNLP